MNTYKINNVKLSVLKKYLKIKGAKKIRTKGGHEIWSHKELNISITFQTHIDPVPGFVISQITEKFNDTKEDFHKIVNPKLKTKPVEDTKPTKRGKRSNKKPGK